jgi:hypothetical protein
MKTVVFSLCLIFSLSLYAELTSNLPLRGQGDYKWFFLHIYEAKLWAKKSDDLYSKPLLLELKYKRSFKGSDIVDQSIKELVHSGTPKNELDQWKPKLLEIFPDVKDGDTIQAHYDPETGVTFLFNSTKDLGRLSDLSFSKKFLDIWLGEKTSAQELRNKLLGKNK